MGNLKIREEDLLRNIAVSPSKKTKSYSPGRGMEFGTEAVIFFKRLGEGKTFFLQEGMLYVGKEGNYISMMSDETWKIFSLGGFEEKNLKSIFLIPKRVVDEFFIYLDSPEEEDFYTIFNFFSRPPWESFAFLQRCPKELIFPPERPSEFVKYLSWKKRKKSFEFNGWEAVFSSPERKVTMDLRSGTVRDGRKDYQVGEDGCRDYIDEAIVLSYKGKDPFGAIEGGDRE